MEHELSVPERELENAKKELDECELVDPNGKQGVNQSQLNYLQIELSHPTRRLHSIVSMWLLCNIVSRIGLRVFYRSTVKWKEYYILDLI